MKKTCKTIASLVMMLVLLLGIGAPAYADGTVSYQGAKKFTFSPYSKYTTTDLFDGLKNVMPGDTLTQYVEIKNDFFGTGGINVYLRAVAHDEVDNPLTYSESFEAEDGKDQAGIPGQRDETVATMSEFLNQLSMEVYKQDGTRIFYDSPDQLDGLQKNVLLATVPRGKSVTLTVILTVPDTMGNKFANRVGEVDWVFTVEELDPQGNPKTGDTSNLTLWIVVMVVCLAAIAVVAFLVLKKKKQN